MSTWITISQEQHDTKSHKCKNGALMASRQGRGYSWKQFEPGNSVAVRHGAFSDRLVDPIAADLVERTAPTCDWWRPCDTPSVHAWARVEARIQLLSEFLTTAATST